MRFVFFFSSRRRHTRWNCDWSSDVCSSDLALAAEVWALALEGAGRLPASYLDPAQLRLAAEFLDDYTLRGRCPADELRAALARGPAAALAWASEPDRTRTDSEVRDAVCPFP